MASQIARFAVKSAQVLVPREALRVQNVRCMSGANPQIQKLQQKFQSDEDTPVYIKGGAFDQILYRTTMGACVLAVGLVAWGIIDMARGKK